MTKSGIMRYIFGATLFLLISCRDAATVAPEKPVVKAISASVEEIRSSADPADILALEKALQRAAPATQKFSVRHDTATLVCGKHGARIHVMPGDLQFADGSPATQSIDVSLVEVQHQGDFVRSGVPTTSDGRLLESGGSYFIGMNCGGKSLQLKTGRKLRMILPRYAKKDMQLFYGERRDGMVNWKPAGSGIGKMSDKRDIDYESAGYPIVQDSVEVQVRVPQYRDSILMDMEATRTGKRQTFMLNKYSHLPRTALKLINYHLYFVCEIEDTSKHVYKPRCVSQAQRLMGQFYETVEANRMGWINCDRFMTEPTYTLTGTIGRSSDVGFAQLYLIYRDINSVARHTIGSSGRSATFTDRVPANRPVQILAVSWKDGRPYLFSQELVVQNNMDVMIDLKPATEKQLAAAMEI